METFSSWKIPENCYMLYIPLYVNFVNELQSSIFVYRDVLILLKLVPDVSWSPSITVWFLKFI